MCLGTGVGVGEEEARQCYVRTVWVCLGVSEYAVGVVWFSEDGDRLCYVKVVILLSTKEIWCYK